MNDQVSSCEYVPGAAFKVPAGSRVHRFQEGFRWAGVPVQAYKQSAEHWCGVTRMALLGETGEQTAFQVRYFEIASGGYSSFERHQHEHAVIVLRGQGEVQLGERVQPISYGDLIYVAPNERHQFRNPSQSEPLGFLCVVDAVRDRPVVEAVGAPG
jgi:quercetin dioxygenase-like cupin family protein